MCILTQSYLTKRIVRLKVEIKDDSVYIKEKICDNPQRLNFNHCSGPIKKKKEEKRTY